MERLASHPRNEALRQAPNMREYTHYHPSHLPRGIRLTGWHAAARTAFYHDCDVPDAAVAATTASSSRELGALVDREMAVFGRRHPHEQLGDAHPWTAALLTYIHDALALRLEHFQVPVFDHECRVVSQVDAVARHATSGAAWLLEIKTGVGSGSAAAMRGMPGPIADTGTNRDLLQAFFYATLLSQHYGVAIAADHAAVLRVNDTGVSCVTVGRDLLRANHVDADTLWAHMRPALGAALEPKNKGRRRRRRR